MPRRVLGRAAVERDLHALISRSTSLHVILDVEAPCVVAGRGAHRVAVGEHLEDGGGDPLGSPGSTSLPVTPSWTTSGRPSTRARDHRGPDRHRLGEHGAERLLVRGQHEHVEVAHEARRVVGPGVVLDVGRRTARHACSRARCRRGHRRRARSAPPGPRGGSPAPRATRSSGPLRGSIRPTKPITGPVAGWPRRRALPAGPGRPARRRRARAAEPRRSATAREAASTTSARRQKRGTA